MNGLLIKFDEDKWFKNFCMKKNTLFNIIDCLKLQFLKAKHQELQSNSCKGIHVCCVIYKLI